MLMVYQSLFFLNTEELRSFLNYCYFRKRTPTWAYRYNYDTNPPKSEMARDYIFVTMTQCWIQFQLLKLCNNTEAHLMVGIVYLPTPSIPNCKICDHDTMLNSFQLWYRCYVGRFEIDLLGRGTRIASIIAGSDLFIATWPRKNIRMRQWYVQCSSPEDWVCPVKDSYCWLERKISWR